MKPKYPIGTIVTYLLHDIKVPAVVSGIQYTKNQIGNPRYFINGETERYMEEDSLSKATEDEVFAISLMFRKPPEDHV